MLCFILDAYQASQPHRQFTVAKEKNQEKNYDALKDP
jgi:hypothetical protein